MVLQVVELFRWDLSGIRPGMLEYLPSLLRDILIPRKFRLRHGYAISGTKR